MLTTAAVAQDSRPSADDLAFFEKRIRPLLVEHCFACHSQSSKKQKGGLHLDSRESILRGGDSGAAVVPGNAKDSLLIQAIHYRNNDPLQMPPKGKLAARDIALLEEWVARGAPFPDTPKTAVAKTGIDWTQARTFWSFRPLGQHEPQAVQNKGWPQQRIDRFILAEQEKRKLTPAPPASRQALIRRAKFDLLGLPPTPEEMEAFIRDPAPDAYAKLLDRWLTSPHYGERWGRHWLDLARYCDIPEPWADVKGHSHLYRDWVVAAFNRDLPFDRFLTYQLAADMADDAQPSDRAALGFLGLSPTYWKELQLPVSIIKEIVSDEYEERIHTLTSTFLGLNVACARCHDHKFDPISAEDYYGLAGVFASCKPADVAVSPGVQSEKIVQARDKVKALEAEVKKWSAKKTPDAPEKVKETQTLLDQFKKANPDWNLPLAPGVVDAFLTVLPAKGHGSVLKYDVGKAMDIPLEIRGNPNKPGPVVTRRFLTVLSPEVPKTLRQGSGRLELAQAILTDGSPLAARVFVNRVWKWHFGIGLVETPSDFGMQGERPTHPELLDDLARRFISSGWSVKWLHREIMLSATYQQASGPAQAGDGDYRWLSRLPRRRLDVEGWRDAMLSVAGVLDASVGGPAIDLGKIDNRRRTLYGIVKRRELTDLLRLHDFPDPITHSPSRVPTTTPLQQLYTLNSPLMTHLASELVKRLERDAGPSQEARIRRAYALLFGRAPSTTELQLALNFLEEGNAAWPQYAQVLLGSNEFLFVD
jgi:hypothetical protein